MCAVKEEEEEEEEEDDDDATVRRHDVGVSVDVASSPTRVPSCCATICLLDVGVRRKKLGGHVRHVNNTLVYVRYIIIIKRIRRSEVTRNIAVHCSVTSRKFESGF